MKTIKIKVLPNFLSAIINDDVSGLTEQEIKIVQTFVDSFPACIMATDMTEPFFGRCELTRSFGDRVGITITRTHFKTRYINRRAHGQALETLVQLDNFKLTDNCFKAELSRLVREYQLSDSSAYYYVSNRSTKEWRAK